MMDQDGRSSCSAHSRTRGRYWCPIVPRLTSDVDRRFDDTARVASSRGIIAVDRPHQLAWRGAGITVYSEARPTVTITEVKMAANPHVSAGHCGLQFARV
jgi:hypothetical protein